MLELAIAKYSWSSSVLYIQCEVSVLHDTVCSFTLPTNLLTGGTVLIDGKKVCIYKKTKILISSHYASWHTACTICQYSIIIWYQPQRYSHYIAVVLKAYWKHCKCVSNCQDHHRSYYLPVYQHARWLLLAHVSS